MLLDQDLDHCDQNYYYSILNLPPVASEYEIRERYRQLSIQFHPDKQHDEATKEMASREFLKIQKAYQVLSDPFLRAVYDTLGEAGLQMKFPNDLNEKSLDEIKSELKIKKRSSDIEHLEDLVRASSRLTVGIDARSLYDGRPFYAPSTLHRIVHKVRNVAISSIGLRHSMQQSINDKTRIQLTTIMSLRSIQETVTGKGRVHIIGTVRHQYSPRLNFELIAPLLGQPSLLLKSNYNDNDNVLSVQTRVSPAMLSPRALLSPPCSVMYSRRLFSDSATQGIIMFDTMTSPSLSVNLTVPSTFDFTPGFNSSAESLSEETGIPNEYGLSKGTSYYSAGLAFSGIASGIRTEWGLVLSRLALQLRLGATLSVLGLNYWLSGSWESPARNTSVDATVTASVQGVSLSLNLRYLGQYFTLPIVLSSNYEPRVAIYTCLVPAVVSIFGYHFIYQPRQVRRRLNYLRKLRSERQSSVEAREANELRNKIIKETSRRHIQTEKAIDGLLIEKATYGCAMELDEARDLVIDVTAPLQSLVHRSQLYIPGRQTKAGLQGFYDPAPLLPKVVRIEYTFRGRHHYAEIRDSLPIVLPLAEHLVE